MVEVYWQEYAKQNYCLILTDIMCWRAYLIIKFNLLEMGARIIFPMATNVLTSCLHPPGYPADCGTPWTMNTSITETSASQCFQVLGEGYSLFCACFVAASLKWWRQTGREPQVVLSVFGLYFQPPAWKHLEETEHGREMVAVFPMSFSRCTDLHRKTRWLLVLYNSHIHRSGKSMFANTFLGMGFWHEMPVRNPCNILTTV